jgi:tRNA-uridine 2-sulfurtransferase
MSGQVLVAMSGGVDSSVAAARLVEQGYEVVGVTMKLWGGDSDTGCCSVADVDDARRVADQLGIDHLVFNFTEDFDRHVVNPYVADHAEGRTPNPCIECNRHLKFDRLFERASLLGFDAVATGHHARIGRDPVSGRFELRRGADRAKDQSYVVHVMDQRRLSRVDFPVGDLTKAQVRAEAERLGLRTAAKPDSQDVCFIQRSAGRQHFLGQRIPLHRAQVVDLDGQAMGEVPAVELVTVGQRRGLGLPGGGEPVHVVAVDVPGRRVTVAHPDHLRRSQQHLERVVWLDHLDGRCPAVHEREVLAQCSAHGAVALARLIGRPDGTATLTWAEPQRVVATGQSVVVYDLDDDRVIAGGLATESTTGSGEAGEAGR